MIKIGINGFGRIGRYLLRLLADDQDLQIAAINARADNAALAYLFKYDSTYGTFAGEVDHDDDGIIVNGRHVAVTRRKAGEWEWKRLGVTLAVETTGTIKDGGLAVKFCIVDDLPALSASGTAAASYCMAYGKPYAYQLDLFGPYSVEVSRDYKFAEGLLAVMGEAMIGGNVVTENGFIRVKKA